MKTILNVMVGMYQHNNWAVGIKIQDTNVNRNKKASHLKSWIPNVKFDTTFESEIKQNLTLGNLSNEKYGIEWVDILHRSSMDQIPHLSGLQLALRKKKQFMKPLLTHAHYEYHNSGR